MHAWTLVFRTMPSYSLSLKPHFPTWHICALQFLALSLIFLCCQELGLLLYSCSDFVVLLSQWQWFKSLWSQASALSSCPEPSGECVHCFVKEGGAHWCALGWVRATPLHSVIHTLLASHTHTPSLPCCPILHFPNLPSLMAFCGPGWQAWDARLCVHSCPCPCFCTP